MLSPDTIVAVPYTADSTSGPISSSEAAALARREIEKV
jgi:hypothetical protein